MVATFSIFFYVAVNNAYQIYRQAHLNPEEYRYGALDLFRGIFDVYYHLYRKSLPSTTLFTGSHSSYITLHTICSLMVSITGLPRTHGDGVAYQDIKEPRYIIAKNAMSYFMLKLLKSR